MRPTATSPLPLISSYKAEKSVWGAVLLMGGQEDPTCSPAAVRELHQRAASVDKEIVQ